MAAQVGRAAAAVTGDLFENGSAYEFFQAVRLLTLAAPDREPVGGDADPEREAVRFRGDVSLAFPASDVRAIVPGKEDGPPEMTVSFFGVATPGSFGSLPTCYTELILHRGQWKDRALRDFLDLFNHRLASLFYRAWEKHRFPLVYERSDARGGGLFEHALFAWMGLHTRGLRGRLSLPDIALARWAAMLSRRPASAGELRDLARETFRVPAEVVPFVATWYVLDEEELTRAARGRGRLGRDTFLGRSVLVAQSRFALRLGALTLPEYAAFLPEGRFFPVLRDLVRLAVGPEYDVELRLSLRREEVPALRLRGPGEAGARLGWTTWLVTRPLAADPADVVVSPSWARALSN
jgi:type VI secretion system protein ImpH